MAGIARRSKSRVQGIPRYPGVWPGRGPHSRLAPRRSGTRKIWWYTIGALTAAAALAAAGAPFKAVLIAVLVLGGLGLVLAGSSAALASATTIVASFAIGYRTVEVTPVLRIHPTEVLIWVAAAVVAVTGRRSATPRRLARFPRWLVLSVPFWVLAGVTGAANGIAWDAMLAEAKDFLLIIPLFLILRRALADKRSWPVLRYTFVGAGVFVAALGLIEYLFPAFARHFSSFMANPAPLVTGGGFARAQFSFWGSPGASFMCFLALPFALGAWMRPAASAADWGRRLAAVILGAGIFIGGYRSLWLATLLVLAISLAIHAKGTLAVVLLLVGASTVIAVPSVTEVRFESALEAVSFRATDSSARKRYHRFDRAVAQAAHDPLGGGWASSGWVHSDLAQIAANQGILAALVVLGGLLSTLIGLWLVSRRFPIGHEGRDRTLELFLAMVMCGVLLAVQGVEVLPQYCVPVWFIWLWSGIWLQALGWRRFLA